MHRFTGPLGHTLTVGFDKAGDLFGAGTTDGTMWIWNTSDLDSPTLHAQLASPLGGIYAFAFSPAHKTLSAAGPHHRVLDWLLEETVAIERIKGTAGDTITPQEWVRYLEPILGDWTD